MGQQDPQTQPDPTNPPAPDPLAEPTTEPTGDEPKVYDESYVTKLRMESADKRKKAEAETARAEKAIARARDLAINAAVQDILQDPTDLLTFEPDADIYDEDGLPDDEKIAAAAEAL